MQSDYDDVRFGDSNDLELVYWINPDTVTAEGFWFKASTINASITTIIYAYYGNDQAVSSINEKNVMQSGYAEDVEPNNTFFTLTDSTENTEQALSITAVSSSTYAGSALFFNTTYYWKVKTRNKFKKVKNKKVKNA